MTFSTLRSVSVSLGFLALASLLTGCTLEGTAPPTATPGVSIQGTVYGGSTPFVLTQIYLYAAGTSGYGGPSVSLLTSNPTYTIEDASGNFYVQSDANGNFSIAGDYTCRPGAQIYLAAFNGRPAGPDVFANTAAAFLAGVGTCPSTGTFAAVLPHVVINEVTTVATAYALAGFMTDASHVSSSGTSLAQTGVANAFANIANLASITSGYALATTPSGGVAPQATLNTLANMLATCINSNDRNNVDLNHGNLLSDPCNALFNLLSNDGTITGLHPNNTVTAILDIAHFPAYNAASLFGLPLPSSPFQPNLTQAPTDWTLGIRFNNGFSYVDRLSIDASGNIWFIDDYNNSLVKLSNLGAPLSPSGGYTGFSGIGGPVAIDTSGDVWTVDSSTHTVGEYNNSGIAISVPGYSIGPSYPGSLALDGLGYVWSSNVTDTNSGSLSKLDSSGTLISPGGGYTGGGLAARGPIAIDGAGSVWVSSGNSLSKFANSGQAVSPSTGYTGALSSSFDLAIDSAGNAWAPNSATSSLAKFSNSGTALTTGLTGGGLSAPSGIAIDGSGNVWVANDNAYSVSEFSNAGVAITPSTGYAGSLFGPYLSPQNIAVDGSGNVWLACAVSSSGPVPVTDTVLELVGAATPVITPIAAGLPSTFTSDGSSNLGTRP